MWNVLCRRGLRARRRWKRGGNRLAVAVAVTVVHLDDRRDAASLRVVQRFPLKVREGSRAWLTSIKLLD